MQTILNTDLLVNPDGSVYHLKLQPEQIADTILIVGDPDRVKAISWYFEDLEFVVKNREFITHTGYVKGKRITVISTGIGTDNIDIVLHELDALVNIDLKKKEKRSSLHSLDIIRIGTSGSIQPDIPVNTFSLSTYGMGLDNLLRYYQSQSVLDKKMESEFLKQTGWSIEHVRPYFVKGTDSLINLFRDGMTPGITATAPGFYGPQGRRLRLDLVDDEMISKLQKFDYQGERIINFEMETSALYGLGALLGHKVVTVCALIANRADHTFSLDHLKVMKEMVELVLDRITHRNENG